MSSFLGRQFYRFTCTTLARLGGRGDPLGILQEIEIWTCYQFVYAQSRIRSGEWDAWGFLGFWDTNKPPNSAQPEYWKKNLSSNGFCRSSKPLCENGRRRKVRLVLGPC